MKKFAFAGVGVAVGFVGALALFPAAHGAPSVLSAYRELDLFGDAFERVRANYVREVEDSELINSAINGMVSSLDRTREYGPEGILDSRCTPANSAVASKFAGDGLVKGGTDRRYALHAGLKTGEFISASDASAFRACLTKRIAQRSPKTRLPSRALRAGTAPDRVTGHAGHPVESVKIREQGRGGISASVLQRKDRRR